MAVERCFDPVADMPGDMAALCLSFLDVPMLLGVAQHVSHTWRYAIDGGLPGVWFDVSVAGVRLAEVVQRSRSRIRNIHLTRITTAVVDGMSSMRSLANLRVLHIGAYPRLCQWSISAILPSFPLLEELVTEWCSGIVLPALQFLRTVDCRHCNEVKGLHSLPSLTKLYSMGCSVDSSLPWSPSIRSVTIRASSYNPQVIHRLAALQQLAALTTDWTFVAGRTSNHLTTPSFFTPPYSQLSFLAEFTSLERLDVNLLSHCPAAILFNYLDAMTSLRDLTLHGGDMTDQDMQCLAQLTQLQFLSLQHIRKITSHSLDHLAVLPNLTKLDIVYCSLVSDFSPVCRCAQVRELLLSDHEHLMTLAEADALSQLKHIEVLVLELKFSISPDCLPRICTMRSLLQLCVCACDEIAPWTTFSVLLSLSSLQKLHMPIKAEYLPKLVECLVQMPKLTDITLGSSVSEISAQDRARLRSALPRLEKLGKEY